MLLNKKLLVTLLICLLPCRALCYNPKALQIKTDTTNFDNNLSAADTDVQKALETMDEMVGGSGSMTYPGAGIGVSTGTAWTTSIAVDYFYPASNPNSYIALGAISATNPIVYNNTTGAISWTNSESYITQATWTSTGVTWAGNAIGNTKGGTAADTSGWTGLAKVSSGNWTTITDSSSNWNTAYGWGDHSTAGYWTTSVGQTWAGNDIALTTNTSGSYVASVATTAPLTGGAAGSEGATITIAIPKADTSTNGYLWTSDWNTFNGKQAALGYTPAYQWTIAGTTGADLIGNTAEVWTITGGAASGHSTAESSNILTINQTKASTTVNGYLWSTDFTTFNDKQAALGFTPSYQWTAAGDSGTPFLVGDTAETVTLKGAGINTVSAGSNVWTVTGTEVDPQVGAVTLNKWCIGDGSAVQCTENTPAGGGATWTMTADSGTNQLIDTTETVSLKGTAVAGISTTVGATNTWTIVQTKADTSTNGYLWTSDWNTFNGKMAGTLEGDLVCTSPITGSVNDIFPGSGTKATIAIPKADTSTNGYLWSTDWTTFNAKQATISNYVGTVADGTGIDGTASGAGSTYTPTIDTTELDALVWDAGSLTNFTWTLDLSGTDVAINWTSAKMDVTGTVNATALTEGGNAVYNSTETPGGELGGTWASPTIDDSVAVTSWNLTTPTITTSLTTSTPTTLTAAELDRLDGLAGVIVTDATACTDLEGVGLAIGTGVLAFASTELEGLTWGAGAAASIVWTANVSGTDTTITHGSALTTFSGSITSTLDLNVNGDDIQLGATGVKITDDTDGAITFLGSSAGADENLIINLDDTANVVVMSSETAATELDWLGTSGSAASFGLGLTGVLISDDNDGAITFTGRSAGSDEDMTFNLDDTANTIVVSSSTAVNSMNWTGIGLSTNLALTSTGTGDSYFNEQVAIGQTSAAYLLDILGADNTTIMRIKNNATQAATTATDIFLSFDSTTGVEGTIAGTAVAGVIGYNTFLGTHWTKIEGEMPRVGQVLEMTGEVTDKGSGGFAYLAKSRICKTAGSGKIYGVYGGTDKEGHDLVFAVGAGVVLVSGKVKAGDLLEADGKGYARKQLLPFVLNSTLGKATQDYNGKQGIKLIGCVFYSG